MKACLLLCGVTGWLTLFGPADGYGRPVRWQLKDLIREADVVVIGEVRASRHIAEGLQEIALTNQKVLKPNDVNHPPILFTVPSSDAFTLADPAPPLLVRGVRYLIFLRSTSAGQPLKLVSSTSGAIRLDVDKPGEAAGLLDGYPPVSRQFTGDRLVERVQELIVEGPSWPPARDRALELQTQGYSSETRDQMVKAAQCEDTSVRCIALGLLAQRQGKDASPILRQALDDPEVEVRWHAAHWLGRLGDTTGLERMRQDFADLAQERARAMSSSSRTQTKDDAETSNYLLLQMLDVARVLAELADQRGYGIAADTVSRGILAEQRYRAATVLVELTKSAADTPNRAEGAEAASLLCEAVKSEEDGDVFYRMVSLVAETLHASTATPVLEAAVQSMCQSEGMRRAAMTYRDTARAKTSSNETE